jgi:hypothetical protein
MKSYGDMIDRVQALRASGNINDRARIRAVMNGGALGVKAVLNWGLDTPKQGVGSGKGADNDLGVDLPTANIMWSGLERLAQKIGREPTLKTDMIPTNDTETARKAAEKRSRIVRAWDDIDRMELQYPQMGRWLPGYGFTVHIIRERDFGGTRYPVAELRDPYDVYPGMWGPNQQPTEVAIVRHMSHKLVRQTYPRFAELFDLKQKNQSGGIPIIGQSSGWEGNPHRPIEVIEYYCGDGTFVLVPEIERTVSHIPNPLTSGPAFVMTKRFSFDLLQSQFQHTFGLMAMMGKLNLLGLISAEESAFRETNIIGEMVGNTYKKGRKAVNLFEPGTRIEKPTGDQVQQIFQSINVLERQFRIVAGYPVSEDGQSPNSFATGQGIRELGQSQNENVKEYQTAIKHSIEMIDMKRLEWEEKMHARTKKRVYWFEGGNRFEETYVPAKDIDGDYRTERVYGAMATFDENSKIVAGLQLLQARVIDRRSFQDELDGFHNVTLINERMDQDQAKEQLIGALGQKAAEGDPGAYMALIEILDKPGKVLKTLKKLFTPEEPQMSPEEQAMMQQAQMGGMGGGGGGPAGLTGAPPPAVQTILSQMETQGGGAMSVGQMR